MGTQTDYRDILKLRIAGRIASNPRLSQANFARRIGVSRAFLALVLAKKKHLPPERLDRLCRALRLDPVDAVRITRSFLRQATSGNYLSNALRDYDAFFETEKLRAGRPVFSASERRLTGDVLTSILFSLAPHLEKIDVSSFAACLRDSFPAESIASSLRWLEENGFLQRNEDDGTARYVARESYLRTERRPAGPEGPAKYIPWLEKLAEVFANPARYRPARVQSATFSFDDEGFRALNEECTRFIERVRKISDAATGPEVRVLHVLNCFSTLASHLIEDPP